LGNPPGAMCARSVCGYRGWHGPSRCVISTVFVIAATLTSAADIPPAPVGEGHPAQAAVDKQATGTHPSARPALNRKRRGVGLCAQVGGYPASVNHIPCQDLAGTTYNGGGNTRRRRNAVSAADRCAMYVHVCCSCHHHSPQTQPHHHHHHHHHHWSLPPPPPPPPPQVTTATTTTTITSTTTATHHHHHRHHKRNTLLHVVDILSISLFTPTHCSPTMTPGLWPNPHTRARRTAKASMLVAHR
jgi:hypothetical protein